MNMIYGVTDADRFLYHYTKTETAIKHILPTRLFKVGSFLGANDPRENKDFRFWLTAAEPSTLLHRRGDELSVQFSQALKALTKVACFCTDSAPLTGDPIRDISNRGLAKPRMWAQYAKNHTGVCFVFDTERFAAQIMAKAADRCGTYGGKVSYMDRIFVASFEDQHYCIDVDYLNRVGLDSYVADHGSQFRHRLFFEKMNDWRDEEEFRWIVLSRAEHNVYIDFSDSLVGVVIGEKTEQIEALLRLLPLNVQTVRLGWINGCPWYDFTEVRCQRDIRAMRGLYLE